MAKKVHFYTLKGEYDHSSMTVSEYDKKADQTSYYSLKDILAQFDGKSFSITVKEEDAVQTIEAPDEE